MAGFVRVFAGLVAGDQLQRAQAGLGLGVGQLAKCIQRQRAPRRLGCQEEQLVQLLRHHGLEQGKQRTQGLADTGAGLGHQAATRAHGLVQGL